MDKNKLVEKLREAAKRIESFKWTEGESLAIAREALMTNSEPVAKSPACNDVLCAAWAAEINVTFDGERYWAETAWGRKETGGTPHEAIVNLIERNSFYYGVTIHHKYGA
jgi:hypothetical protein